MSDELFPKLKNGRAVRPNVGGYVYVPTCREKKVHLIGGRGKVTVSQGSILQIAEHPGMNWSWNAIRPLQYDLWRTFGAMPAHLPSEEEIAELDEELKIKAEDAEALRVKQQEAIDRYYTTPKTLSPRAPTHVLKVKDRNGSVKGEAGVAWLNEDGSLHIILNPCVVLAWNDNVHLTLFPK